MTTIQVMIKRQDLLKAMRLLAANVITQNEYNEIQQSYLDCYLLYVNY